MGQNRIRASEIGLQAPMGSLKVACKAARADSAMRLTKSSKPRMLTEREKL